MYSIIQIYLFAQRCVTRNKSFYSLLHGVTQLSKILNENESG